MRVSYRSESGAGVAPNLDSFWAGIWDDLASLSVLSVMYTGLHMNRHGAPQIGPILAVKSAEEKAESRTIENLGPARALAWICEFRGKNFSKNTCKPHPSAASFLA